MYKVLIFDFDGTLCSSAKTVQMAMQNTFAHFGRKKPTELAIKEMLHQGPSLEDSFFFIDASLKQLSASELSAWLIYFRQNYMQHLSASVLYPHAKPLLKKLHALGFHCIIVSNKHSSSINACLTNDNIVHFFSAVYGEDSGHLPKPSPLVFERIILPHYPQYSLQDFLMIGDTEADCLFAEACGIDMAWATYGFGDPQSSPLQQATYKLKSLLELEMILGLSHD